MKGKQHSSIVKTSESGFSLIEVLIALVILATGATALIGIGESHLNRLYRLENQASASWVAQNRLVELRRAQASQIAGSQERHMRGKTWIVEVSQAPTTDPELVQVTIQVIDPISNQENARLTGFIDIGAGK